MTVQNTTIVGVHRFREHVAVSVGDGDTIYFTAKQAMELSKAISDCAIDTFWHPDFVCSQFRPVEITTTEDQ